MLHLFIRLFICRFLVVVCIIYIRCVRIEIVSFIYFRYNNIIQINLRKLNRFCIRTMIFWMEPIPENFNNADFTHF